MFVCWSSARVAYDVIYVLMHRAFRDCCCCGCSLAAAPNVCKALFITIDMHSLLFAAVRSLDIVSRLSPHVIRALKFAIVETFKRP